MPLKNTSDVPNLSASSFPKRPLCVVVVGPTASGKSLLASEVAHRHNGEIISMDSTAIYDGFHIGTDRPSPEVLARCPHHLLGTLPPLAPYSAHEFAVRAAKKMQEILHRQKTPFLVGGTYFYLRALQHGMLTGGDIPESVFEEIDAEFDPETPGSSERLYAALLACQPQAAERLHPRDRYRCSRALAYARTTGKSAQAQEPVLVDPFLRNVLWLKYATLYSRAELHTRIEARTDRMLQAGLVDETKKLLEAYPLARALQSIGYKECVAFLRGHIRDQATLRQSIREATRQLAKRQMVWLRQDYEIRYVDHRDGDRMSLDIENLRAVLSSHA